jgi:hypothetical protein
MMEKKKKKKRVASPAASSRTRGQVVFIYTMPIRAGHVKWNRAFDLKNEILYSILFSFLFFIA